MTEIKRKLKDFYNDLAVNCNFVCNVNDWDLTPRIRDIVAHLHPETMRRYLGSGLIIPDHIEGKRVIDIGCGSGSLVFILSNLVGPTGSVLGMDLCPNLIEECKKREDYHREKWGYDKKNTDFFVGEAEDLSQLQDQSFDIVVSNGVMCLLPDKEKGFAEAYRVLKNGGEFYMNDVYAAVKLTDEMKTYIKSLGLTGSQMVQEFHTSVKVAGFTSPYLTCVGPIKLSDECRTELPSVRYCTAGNRMFRLDGVNKRGPASLSYKGNIKGHESEFRWDVDLTFKTGQAVTVDGDLATIVTNSRYRDVFDKADASGSSTTEKVGDVSYGKGKSRTAQDPFWYLDYLSSQGTTLPHIYSVE